MVIDRFGQESEESPREARSRFTGSGRRSGGAPSEKVQEASEAKDAGRACRCYRISWQRNGAAG